MTPYQAMRTLIEAVSTAALDQVIRALEAEDAIPDQMYSHSVTWETLDRIRRAGILIGSHTRTHIVMTNETANALSTKRLDPARNWNGDWERPWHILLIPAESTTPPR